MDSTDPNATAFILAGGASRRMERDKALLPWRGTTLLEHMQRVLGSVVDTVRVVGRAELPDRSPGDGPVEGIRTALCASATDINLIVAVDLPFLSAPVLQYMLQRLHKGSSAIVVCADRGRVPLCMAARKELSGSVEAYLARGERSFEGLLDIVSPIVLTEEEVRNVAGTAPDFQNLNTWADYEAAIKRSTEGSEPVPESGEEHLA